MMDYTVTTSGGLNNKRITKRRRLSVGETVDEKGELEERANSDVHKLWKYSANILQGDSLSPICKYSKVCFTKTNPDRDKEAPFKIFRMKKHSQPTSVCEKQTEEQWRMEEHKYDPSKRWAEWGPYLSERQWGTVREDYSKDGSWYV